MRLCRFRPPPHPITVYASHPPSPTTAQHSLPGGALPPYRGRSFTGRIASASPDAPVPEVRILLPPAVSHRGAGEMGLVGLPEACQYRLSEQIFSRRRRKCRACILYAGPWATRILFGAGVERRKDGDDPPQQEVTTLEWGDRYRTSLSERGCLPFTAE